MRIRFSFVVAALAAVLSFPVSSFAQTALSETTLSAAVTSSQNFVTVASATGAVAGGGLYVDREYMTIGAGYVSGTRIPVVRAGAAVSHAASMPVYIAPAVAFGNRDYDGSCVAAEQDYLPKINVSNGKVWDCNSAVEKWVDLRELVTVTCRALLVADQLDQSCFTANRPYLVYRINEVHTTAESAGTLTIIPRRQQGTEAPASGDALTAAAIDMVGAGAVAQTVKTPTLTTSEALLILATGDRLGLDFTDDTAGELAGVTVTFYLYPL
jgi:hypothetical protein